MNRIIEKTFRKVLALQFDTTFKASKETFLGAGEGMTSPCSWIITYLQILTVTYHKNIITL